jgi:beta-lactamase class A
MPRRGREGPSLLPDNYREVAVVSVAAAVAITLGLGVLEGHASRSADSAANSDSSSAAVQVDSAADARTEAAETQGQAVGSGTLEVTGIARDGSAQEVANLESAISGFEGNGWSLGIYLEDLDGETRVSYNAESSFYTASSIKGPYVCALLQELVDTGQVSWEDVSDRVTRTIVDSDNDAYASLVEQYGQDFFVSWLDEHDVSFGPYETRQQYIAWKYPHSTPHQLAEEWEAVYAYLSSGDGHSSDLAGLFQARTTSPIADALGDRYVTWSKAGWYPKDESAIFGKAANDAGVVLVPASQGGPYIVVVMSTAPAELDQLEPVISALDTLDAAERG